jgi:hypothetical protein
MPAHHTHQRRPARPVSPARSLRWAMVTAPAVLLAMLAGCGSSGTKTDPAAVQPSQRPLQTVRPVPLGTAQKVAVASSFGPGTADVPATITVYAVRDHVAPGPAIRPLAAASHWASADVRICRDRPVVLGYPAWVLGDDQGRTAQVTKVLHPQFPQPTLPNGPTLRGCSRGWVTWVVANDLVPTKVTFEQTHDIPGAWRIRG